MAISFSSLVHNLQVCNMIKTEKKESQVICYKFQVLEQD
jgi:hypothetical protein